MKRFISVLLALIIICGVIPLGITTFAASGTCGSNLRWSIEGTRLHIYGDGYMDEFSSYKKAPWYYSDAGYAYEHITEIEVGEGVKSISQYAFCYFKKLSYLKLPQSLERIGYEAFYQCETLPEVVIPGNCTSVGEDAFVYCYGLKKVCFMEGVKIIGQEAFSECTALEQVYFPVSLEKIKVEAFEYDKNIKTVWCAADKWVATVEGENGKLAEIINAGDRGSLKLRDQTFDLNKWKSDGTYRWHETVSDCPVYAVTDKELIPASGKDDKKPTSPTEHRVNMTVTEITKSGVNVREFYDIDLAEKYFNIAYTENLKSMNIKLNKDCVTKGFPINSACDYTIDLNGYSWTVTGTSRLDTTHNVSISGGTMSFTGGASYPIYVKFAKLSIRNVVFKDCYCGKYGLIYMDWEKSVLEMNNVTFDNCSSTSYGGCIYMGNNTGVSAAPELIATNCTFKNCHSDYGGAIYLNTDNSKYRFTNCEFDDCYATTDGGGIYCESEHAFLEFTNCTAYRCHADDCGGFLFCSGEYTTYNGAGSSNAATLAQRSSIVGCYAIDSGGAFYSSVNASCSNGSVLKNFNLVSNTAGSTSHDFEMVKKNNNNSWGGAVCFRGRDMKLQNCDLYDNYGSYYGGAVYCGWSGSSIENCSFYQNKCQTENSDDIYLDSKGGIDIKDCIFLDDGKTVGGKASRIESGNKRGMSAIDNSFSSNEIEAGDYIIYSALDESYALDIEGGKGSVNVSGRSVHLWQNGDADVFSISKEKGAYTVKSKVTGLVLDVAGGSTENGANIQQWGSNGTDAQRWVFEPAGDGYYYIRCIGGQYMDASGMVNGAKPTNGVNIQSWEYTGAANQKFKFVKVNDIEEGDYVIYSALDESYALDIEGGKGSVNVSGRSVHLWQNGDADVFSITKDKEKGTYTIKSKVTGLVLDVSGGSKDNGANIQQWGSNGTDAQRWVFEPAGNGYYYIRCIGGQYMDASGMVNDAKPTNGVNIQSWECTGAANQKFKLVKVASDKKSKAEDGDGSKENPYKIRNASQWKKFAIKVASGETYSGKYFELCDDISVSYVPVGNYNAQKPFMGNLNGKNHTITYLDSSEKWDRGVFSFCKNATVKNLSVTGKITGTIALAGVSAAAENTTFENCINNAEITGHNEYAGGIAAKTSSCKFINCTNNGTIRSGNFIAGGIAAFANGNSRFVDCRNNGTVYAATDNSGGIVGEVNDNVSVIRCVNNARIESGNVTAGGMIGCVRKNAEVISCINTHNGDLYSKGYAGGMIAWVDTHGNSINVKNSVNNGGISADSYGGIVANDNNDNMNVINCFNASTRLPSVANSGAIALTNSKGNFVNCFCIAGAVTDSHATVLQAADCGDTLKLKMNAYIADKVSKEERPDWADWQTNAETGIALPDISNIYEKHITGNGTAASPYLISSAQGLKELAKNLELGVDTSGKYYRLTKNFTYTGSSIGLWNNPFKGIFDGNGNKLTVAINGDDTVGLFAFTYGAEIRNLDIECSVVGNTNIAGLVGNANTTKISNCRVGGTVMGRGLNVGGIAAVSYNTDIWNCRVDATVIAGWQTAGGIVSWMLGKSSIINCVKTGDTRGQAGVGGIVGIVGISETNANIINCANLGNIKEIIANNETPRGKQGGIVGWVDKSETDLTLVSCFSAATFTKDAKEKTDVPNVGNIVGYSDAEIKGENLFMTNKSYKEAGKLPDGAVLTATSVTKLGKAKLKNAMNGFITDAKSEKYRTLVFEKTKGTMSVWEPDSASGWFAPKSYVQISTQTASIFTAKNITMLLILSGASALALAVAYFVYRKSKKKKSGAKPKQETKTFINA